MIITCLLCFLQIVMSYLHVILTGDGGATTTRPHCCSAHQQDLRLQLRGFAAFASGECRTCFEFNQFICTILHKRCFSLICTCLPQEKKKTACCLVCVAGIFCMYKFKIPNQTKKKPCLTCLQIETEPNPRGVCALCPSSSTTVLACPSPRSGESSNGSERIIDKNKILFCKNKTQRGQRKGKMWTIHLY